MPAWAEEKARSLVEAHARSFRLAHEAGVRIAFGTDSGVGPHGANAEELELMVRYGMSPLAALRSATAQAAALLRLDDRLGTIEPGKIADVILVDGDPVADIRVLCDTSRISLVMKDGQVFKDLTGRITNTDLLEATEA